jgi:hypothetical protein
MVLDGPKSHLVVLRCGSGGSVSMPAPGALSYRKLVITASDAHYMMFISNSSSPTQASLPKQKVCGVLKRLSSCLRHTAPTPSVSDICPSNHGRSSVNATRPLRR